MSHQPQVPQHFRGRWSSRLGFIMAAAGSAVGLGTIWKFPYITGMHGGGAFVLMGDCTQDRPALSGLTVFFVLCKSTVVRCY